nr:MAG TPA: hypothetical protein [Caudoviricetes sp.]
MKRSNNDINFQAFFCYPASAVRFMQGFFVL